MFFSKMKKFIQYYTYNNHILPPFLGAFISNYYKKKQNLI